MPGSGSPGPLLDGPLLDGPLLDGPLLDAMFNEYSDPTLGPSLMSVKTI